MQTHHSAPSVEVGACGVPLPTLAGLPWVGVPANAPSCSRRSREAYAFYATNDEYAKNVAVNVRRLYLYGAAVGRDVVLVLTSGVSLQLRRTLVTAGVTCFYERSMPRAVGDPTWADSMIKLHILGLTDYERLLYFDSDGLVVGNPDRLFAAPLDLPYQFAMPRNYWENNPVIIYSSMLILVRPSLPLLTEVEQWHARSVQGAFDMDIINRAFSNITLPYPSVEAPLIMLLDEKRLISDGWARWFDGRTVTQIMANTTYVHFSVWPMPKPWLMAEQHVAPLRVNPATRCIADILDLFRAELALLSQRPDY